MSKESVAAKLVSCWVCEDGASLYDVDVYVAWSVGDDEVTIDGKFSVEELEAICLHIRSKTDETK